MKLNIDDVKIDYLYRLVEEVAKINPNFAVYNIFM